MRRYKLDKQIASRQVDRQIKDRQKDRQIQDRQILDRQIDVGQIDIGQIDIRQIGRSRKCCPPKIKITKKPKKNLFYIYNFYYQDCGHRTEENAQNRIQYYSIILRILIVLTDLLINGSEKYCSELYPRETLIILTFNLLVFQGIIHYINEFISSIFVKKITLELSNRSL